jgi:anti-anti-sigma factor
MVAEIVKLAGEWKSVADRADCKSLVVDCSNAPVLSSDMLSKLILLQWRLKQKEAKVVLSGLRAEVREVLRWTRLDRFFEINEDEKKEVVAAA